ncbi:MAG: hypothetical protein M1281_17885, partial [Chloroflexi bacterium]|nr:hypothetical protein [Chloroflexota bacterium]
EMDAVLQAAEKHRQAKKADARPYTLLLLLLDTGIKKGECLALEPGALMRLRALTPTPLPTGEGRKDARL